MKSKLTIVIAMIIAIMLIGGMVTSVDAAYSAQVQMVPNKTEVNPGETINVVINLTNVVDAGEGADVMGGKIEYDANFFENITASQGSWMLNNENGLFNLTTNPLKADGQFAVLQFKVSESATGSTTVKFTELTTTAGEEEPTSPDITLNFSVISEEEPEETNESTTDNSGTNNPTEEGQTEDENTPSSNEDKNTVPDDKNNGATTLSKLPAAGLTTGIIVAAVILVVIIIASFLLYRYPKIK